MNFDKKKKSTKANPILISYNGAHLWSIESHADTDLAINCIGLNHNKNNIWKLLNF